MKSYEDIGNLRKFEPKVDLSIKNNLKRDGQRLVKKNYIDSQVSLQEWGSDHSVPDINEFLLRNDFTEKHDRFILLNGLVHQHNKSFERQIFFQVDTIFVNSKVLKQACQAFKKSKKFGWANHSAPSSTHIHESEIPDADVIPHNDFTEWHYSISSKTVEREYTKFDLIKNGRILEEEDANHVWENVLNNNGYIVAQRENRSDFRVPFVRFASPITIDISLEEAFKQMGIELKEVTIKKKEVEEIDKKLQVFIPVRQLKDKFYLCKNIIDHFKLSSKIDDTDLFDPDGNLASFNFTFEVEYVDQENFTYLRKDLLDRYLQEKELTMFTIIWGERDYYPPDGDWMRRTEKIMNRKWSEFYEWREYKM